jgi:hypothetical protein
MSQDVCPDGEHKWKWRQRGGAPDDPGSNKGVVYCKECGAEPVYVELKGDARVDLVEVPVEEAWGDLDEKSRWD